nr:MAG TPA: hypothetical protein [Caudoviricetes sp.]
MEVLTRRKIFLHTDFSDYDNCYGDGYGDGDGDGYGFRDGNGYGSGDVSGSGYGEGFGYGWVAGVGYGSSDGSGYGYNSSYGYGYGLKSIDSQLVDMIDDVPTILASIIGNVAKGFIVRADFSLAPTFVCKQDNTFAHGETLHEAWKALLEKLFDNMPTEKRIEAFCKEFKPGIKRPVMDFFSWHHRLTGSCEQGRREFAWQHHIDIDHDELTPEEFFALTRNSYGSSIIRQTEKAFACQCETELMN